MRRQAKYFAAFLSPQSGKKRSYTIADLDTLKRIQELSAKGLSYDQIAQTLTIVSAPPADTALVSVADFAQALEGANAQLASLQAQVTKQAEELDAIFLEFFVRHFCNFCNFVAPLSCTRGVNYAFRPFGLFA